MLNKYWTKPQPQTVPFTHNGVTGSVTVDWLRAHNSVTHRQVGDIPGIVEAPRSGTFKNTSIEEARKVTGARADKYAEYLTKYVKGEYGGKEGLKEMWSAVGTLKPMFGAFGERL